MKTALLSITLFFVSISFQAKEYHVSSKVEASGDGSLNAPFKTIGEAAQIAVAGDIVTVHDGVYREWVNPKNSGKSDKERIVYQVAKGEKAAIKGSEIVTGWKKQKDGTWMITLPDSFFKGYNSFKTNIEGDWFNPLNAKISRNHTADVYINGNSLFEADSLLHVIKGTSFKHAVDTVAATYRWYCENDDKGTTIWANFQGKDPNKELVEVSVRPTCFYPTKQGINYLTIKGFDISQAASQWGAPTAEQIGMVATHWNKGWIIEGNKIHDTKCSGITLGKERTTGHNVWSNNRQKDGSLHYVETTFKAIEHGWNRDNIGSHIVRNNEIYNCEQTGICGSMGCSFSQIYGNHIYNIWVKRQFNGAEIGGIKFHAAIDTQISDNYIHNCQRGIWLDWMTQGTRVSSNLLHDNPNEDLFIEVNHGPYIIDNNICLSTNSVRNQSQGGAFIHNLFCGENYAWNERSRYTPYHYKNSTRVKGLSIITSGDDRYFNNIFIPMGGKVNRHGLEIYNESKFPQYTLAEGNIYHNTAKPYTKELRYIGLNDKKYSAKIETEKDGTVYLVIELASTDALNNNAVTSEMLGKTLVSEERFEDSQGNDILFNKDYFGNLRSTNPSAGPFEKPENNREIRVKVWPKS